MTITAIAAMARISPMIRLGSRLASLPGGSHSVGGRTYFERPRTRRILRPLESHQYKKADVDGCVRQMAIPYLP